MNTIKLPEQFSELEPFIADWANHGMQAQYDKRLGSTIEQLQEFYDAVKPRILEVRAYLDEKDFDDYTEADSTLGRLVIAWVPVAEAVEVFKQPRVPDSKMYWEIVDEPHLF
ncbi:MAG: hypothetical protein AAGF57_20955 [Pseudomonadota bacterium]